MMTEYEWDEGKRLSNIEKHGLDFLDVHQVFEGAHIRSPAQMRGEERFLATGFLNGKYVTVFYTIRGSITRIISLRRARTNERKQHQTLHGQ